jgi:hypothetical protein
MWNHYQLVTFWFPLSASAQCRPAAATSFLIFQLFLDFIVLRASIKPGQQGPCVWRNNSYFIIFTGKGPNGIK